MNNIPEFFKDDWDIGYGDVARTHNLELLRDTMVGTVTRLEIVVGETPGYETFQKVVDAMHTWGAGVTAKIIFPEPGEYVADFSKYGVDAVLATIQFYGVDDPDYTPEEGGPKYPIVLKLNNTGTWNRPFSFRYSGIEFYYLSITADGDSAYMRIDYGSIAMYHVEYYNMILIGGYSGFLSFYDTDTSTIEQSMIVTYVDCGIYSWSSRFTHMQQIYLGLHCKIIADANTEFGYAPDGSNAPVIFYAFKDCVEVSLRGAKIKNADLIMDFAGKSGCRLEIDSNTVIDQSVGKIANIESNVYTEDGNLVVYDKQPITFGKHSGTTAERPVQPTDGFSYFDKDLNKAIWYINGAWVDATGTAV